MHSCLSEFNEEAFRKGIHNEGFGEGFDNAISKFIQKSQFKGLSFDDTITEVMDYFDLTKEKAAELVKEYWK